MSDRLTQRFSNLSYDTATVVMPPGAAIRRRGDRRTRRTVVTSALAVAAVLVAGAAGTSVLVDRRGAAPLPAESPSVSASPSTSTAGSPSAAAPTTAAKVITSIPASAMLQRSDLKLRAEEPTQYGPRSPSELTKLRPCGSAFASDALRTATRGVGGTATLSAAMERTGTGIYGGVDEQLSAYRQGGARQFMTELRDQIQRCPGQAGLRTNRWTVVDEDLGGDESLLIERAFLYTFDESVPVQEFKQYVGVVRAGDLIVVVGSDGWETPTGFEVIVRHFMPVAVQRAATLG
jgi:hypothetical protein